MFNLVDRIGDWFASLQQQEQRILLIGAPVILILVLYLVLFQPLGSAYFSRQSEMADRREDLAWVREQRPMLERLNSSCDIRSPVFAAEGFEIEVEATARRFGLNPTMRAQRGAAGYELQIPTAEGNRVLSLVRALACGGVKVTRLEMQQDGAESNEMSATLSVVHAGVGG